MKDNVESNRSNTSSGKNSSRRTFLKTAGVATIGVSAFAGCSGDGGNGNGNGGNGNGNGNGGNGNGNGNGGTNGTATDELTQVNMVMPGTGFQGLMMNHLLDEGILEEEMNQRGYTMNLQETFEGAALFAAGGPDFTTMSTFEAARLSAQRDMNLATFGRVAPDFMGFWVKRGGELDPANTGSVQNSIDELATTSAKVGIGSWAGGDVPPNAMVLDRVYGGYTFAEGQSDFNVVTANYGAIPQLIVQGDLEAGSTSPVHGVARQLDENGEPKLTKLFTAAQALAEAGYGVPLLNSLTTNQSFIDENEGACTALLQAWTRGMDWLFEDPMARIEANEEKNLEILHLSNMNQAEYLVNWGIEMTLDNDYPIVFNDIGWTDSTIEEDQAFLTAAQEAGFVPQGYEDRLTWADLPTE